MSFSGLPTLFSLEQSRDIALVNSNNAITDAAAAEAALQNAINNQDSNAGDLTMERDSANENISNTGKALTRFTVAITAYNDARKVAQENGYGLFPNLLDLASRTAAQAILAGAGVAAAAEDASKAVNDAISAAGDADKANAALGQSDNKLVDPNKTYNVPKCSNGTIIKNKNKVYYPNYQISFNLSATDFGLTAGTDLATTISNIEAKFPEYSAGTPFTASNGQILFTSESNIPSGIVGWATVFVTTLASYFKIDFKRIYNVTVVTIPSTTTNLVPSKTLGVTLSTTDTGTGIGKINVSYCIDNQCTYSVDYNNNLLPAGIIGPWMVAYFNNFIPNKTQQMAGSAAPGRIYLNQLFAPTNSNLSEINSIPYLSSNNGANFNVDLQARIIAAAEMNTALTSRGLPDMSKYKEGFTSQINNIFKRIHDKKFNEHLDGGGGTGNTTTVTGRLIHETCSTYLTELAVAPWSYNPTNTTPRTNDKITVSFALTPDDFELSKDTPNVYNVWQRLTNYMGVTSFNFFGTPSTFKTPTTTGTGASGYIQELLDIFAEILQVSPSRFTDVTADPADSDGVKITNITDAASYKTILVKFNVNNIVPNVNPAKNDFLDAGIIGTWLTNYWTSYEGGMNTLQPFLPVPVNIINGNGATINPYNGKDMPINGEDFTIVYNPLPNTTALPYYKTIMKNPYSRFTGGVDINPFKLASRIKNIKITLYNNTNTIENFGNNRLLEHAFIPRTVNPSTFTPNTFTITNAPGMLPASSFSVLDYIFYFSYIICFVSAVVLSVSQLFGMNILDYLLNNSYINWIYFYIGLCSIIALFSWFDSDIWYIDPSIINPGNVAVYSPFYLVFRP